jgi:hypothetical protein
VRRAPIIVGGLLFTVDASGILLEELRKIEINLKIVE